VARLTLEVSGLPELSVDRIVGWPNPNFIQPTKSHVFEVSSMSFPFVSLV
jgi:hypothetical protein